MDIPNFSRRDALTALGMLPLLTLPSCVVSEPSGMIAPVSVLDFIPTEFHAAIRDYTSTVDVSAYFQQAAVAANRGQVAGEAAGGTVLVPNGLYRVNSVGIRDTCLVGESRGGTILRALAPGSAAQFILDAMLDRDGVTKNTRGRGWAERMTIDSNGMGRSCLRVYGGGVSCRDLTLQNGSYGLSAGLPMWSSFSNIHSEKNYIGFHTFHDVAGDIGTSASFENCWADTSGMYGFHITQLTYSSFISCVAQDSGTHNWFIDGNANGVPAVYSLIFLTCASEGAGTPFYLKKIRDLTLINPRIIGSPVTDYIILDDVQGSIRDFSAVAAPMSGRYHLKVTDHTSDLGSILIDNCYVTYPAGNEIFFTVSGGVVNGMRCSLEFDHRWNALNAVEHIVSRVEQIDGYSGLEFSNSDGMRLAAFRRIGTPIFKTNGPILNPLSSLERGDVSFYVDGDTLRFVVKDTLGAVRTGSTPLS